MLDQTFTPAVLSGIEILRVSRIETGEQGYYIPGTVVSNVYPLNDIRGPITLVFIFDDLPELLEGHGYQVIVSTLC